MVGLRVLVELVLVVERWVGLLLLGKMGHLLVLLLLVLILLVLVLMMVLLLVLLQPWHRAVYWTYAHARYPVR